MKHENIENEIFNTNMYQVQPDEIKVKCEKNIIKTLKSVEI